MRNKLDLTQEALAARCQLHGLDISRGTLSQIEARLRRVADSELFRLSVVLNVSTDDLFPSDMRKERDKLRTRQ
ncbi:MAG: helix-turn-helix transcriptional regulator [bacterium]